MKKRIFSFAFVATMIFGTALSAQDSLMREFDTEPTHMINPDDPYDCSREFAWDCRA